MTGRGGMKIAGDPAALIKNESCCKGILALLIMLSHMHLGGRIVVLVWHVQNGHVARWTIRNRLRAEERYLHRAILVREHRDGRIVA